MAEEAYKFPDEIEAEQQAAKPPTEKEELEDKLIIEVEDDTPPEDRNVRPLPKETVESLDNDDLASYGKRVKTRLAEMKKVWHDERRAKESADRERQEAVTFAQRILEENKRLKSTLSEGGKQYASTIQSAATLEVEAAKRAYKDAYDSGDGDKLAEAQQLLTQASIRQEKAQNYKPPLQIPENDVDLPPVETKTQSTPKVDPVTSKWLDTNTWYGSTGNRAMTSYAIGVHGDLEEQYGGQYVGSADYFEKIDAEMRKRFPEKFASEAKPQAENTDSGSRTVRNSPVVAPATRSTASKRIVLKATQVALAKKFGLTNEQYAQEAQKLENNNG
jgi:hypothetical protein